MNKLYQHKRTITTTHAAFHCIYWGHTAIMGSGGFMTLLAGTLCILTICMQLLNEENV